MKKLVGHLMIAVIRLFSLMPLPLAHKVGRAAAWLAWHTGGSFRRIAEVNPRLCWPAMKPDERQQFIRRAFRQNAMMFSEMGLMWARPVDHALGHIRDVHGEEIFQQALAAGKGVLLLAPHLGNWELTNTYIASRTQLTAMYRPARNPVFDEWMHGHREKTGADLVPTTTGGIKALYRCLRGGGVVGILPDQEPQPESGEFAPFLGVEALTPTLPVQLLQRTGARAVLIYARRLDNDRGFDIHFAAPDDDIYDSDAGVALTAMNRSVEQCLQTCPDQYQWLYKRFKRQPGQRGNRYKAATD